MNRNDSAVARSAGSVCFSDVYLGLTPQAFMLTPASRVREIDRGQALDLMNQQREVSVGFGFGRLPKSRHARYPARV